MLEELIKTQNIQFIKGDITKFEDVHKASKRQDYIFHLAAINGTRFFYEKPDKVLDVSCKGIINVIEVAKKLKIKTSFWPPALKSIICQIKSLLMN